MDLCLQKTTGKSLEALEKEENALLPYLSKKKDNMLEDPFATVIVFPDKQLEIVSKFVDDKTANYLIACIQNACW